jgi:hypothetical protein
MTNQIDTIRRLFLEKQLAMLPTHVISIIREHDSIFKDHFTKRVLRTLADDVAVFWEKKLSDLTSDMANVYKPNYFEQSYTYYYMVCKVLPTITKGENEDGDGLFIVY